MSSRRRSLLIVAGMLICAVPRLAVADPAAAPAPASGAGSRIKIDPQTGKRIPVPSDGVALPADPAFSTSHSGLVEQPAPGGGMMVDLQGRFRSAATATVGPDGTAHVDCIAPGGAAERDVH